MRKISKRIQKINLPANLSISREIFLFAVYTGVAYTDMTKLTNENITIGIDHTPWLNYKRQKTGARVALPLLEPPTDHKKFDCYNTHKPNSHPFPLICNQVINRNLKKIAKAANVKQTSNLSYCNAIRLPLQSLYNVKSHWKPYLKC